MKLTCNLNSLLLVLSMILMGFYGINAETIESDGSVRLPSEKQCFTTSNWSLINSTNSNEIRKVNNDLTDWVIVIDKQTKSTAYAYGIPIKVAGYDLITKENAEAAALKFLNEYSEAFSYKDLSLRLSSVIYYDKMWYVLFIQTFNEKDVLGSFISLRMSGDGRIGYISSNYYNEVVIPISIQSIGGDIKSTATKGLYQSEKAIIHKIYENEYILPYRTQNEISYHRVKKVDFYNFNRTQCYTSLVDVNSGELLPRINLTHNANPEVSVQGTVKMTKPTDNPVMVDFNDFKFNWNSKEYLTNHNGKVSVEGSSSPALLKAGLEGQWAKVIVVDSNNTASYERTTAINENYNLIWDDDNSDIKQRMLYYYANKAHDYIKMIDPDFAGLDHCIEIYIYNKNSPHQKPNAGSDPFTGNISYYYIGDKSFNFAECPSILYHEYGHGVVGKLYEKSATCALTNITLHEAFADLYTAMLEDNYSVGVGYKVNEPETPIRSLKNNCRYPEDINYEPHHDSRILSGAYWDLKEMVDLDYARKITHKVKYAFVDGSDIKECFLRLFMETLVADDDNFNLLDGTPHLVEICKAFNNHNIGSQLYLDNSFKHKPYSNTPDKMNGYDIAFNIGGFTLKGTYIDSAKVVYNINGSAETSDSVKAVKINNDTYTAHIPAQNENCTVNYHIVTYLNHFDNKQCYYVDSSKKQDWSFLVGYTNVLEDLHSPFSSWISGANGDDATNCVWEYGSPERFYYIIEPGTKLFQPKGSYFEPEGKCWVTGTKGGSYMFTRPELVLRLCPNGYTSLVSPVYNLEGYDKPFVEFDYWFAYLHMQNGTGYVKLHFEISTDMGNNWVEVNKIERDSSEWLKYRFDLANYYAISHKLMFRFKVEVNGFSDTYADLLPRYCSKSLIDNFAIWGIKNSTGVDDNYQLKISTYPNPASEYIEISGIINHQGEETSDNGFYDSSTIKIYNSYGECVITELIHPMTSSYRINIKKLPAGMYIIRIGNKVEKFVKM